MDNPFDDLIPKQPVSDPFSDLVPGKENRVQTFKNAAWIGTPSFTSDIAGGILHGLQGLAKRFPDLSYASNSQYSPFLYKAGMSPADTADAYKAMGTENNPLKSFRGALQLAGELVPFGEGIAGKSGIAKKALVNDTKSIADLFSPQKHAEQLLNELGSGAKNSEDVSKSLSNDIRNAHNMRRDESSVFFNHALDRAGQEKIYEKPDPLITTAIDKGKRMIDKVGDLNVGELYDIFKAKPTFDNAHRLQSELGVMIRGYEKNPHLTMEEARQISQLKGARDLLKEDIGNFLERRDANSNENLSAAYNKGGELYNEHVAPYLSSKDLRDIVRGNKTVTKNVHKIFDSPYDIIDKATDEIRPGDINKIMQDLPESVKGKILFSKVGGYKYASKPETLHDKLKSAEMTGYSKYFTPELKKSMIEMSKKVRNKKILPWAAAGAGIGVPTGIYGLSKPIKSYLDVMEKGNEY